MLESIERIVWYSDYEPNYISPKRQLLYKCLKNSYPFLLVEPTQAQISTNASQPILDKMEDYYLSIIRFSVPGLNLPLCQMLVQTPVIDINKLIYSF